MIVGIGIDIAEVPRIRKSIERFGTRFLERIYTVGERRYCDSKANRFELYAAIRCKGSGDESLRHGME